MLCFSYTFSYFRLLSIFLSFDAEPFAVISGLLKKTPEKPAKNLNSSHFYY